METSVEDCQAIIDAAEQSGATLMLAYRLHQEPGTVASVGASLAVHATTTASRRRGREVVRGAHVVVERPPRRPLRGRGRGVGPGRGRRAE